MNQAPEPPPDRPATASVAAPGSSLKGPDLGASLDVRESIDANPSFGGAKLGAAKASFKNLKEENFQITSTTPVQEGGMSYPDVTYSFRDGALETVKFTVKDAALCTKTAAYLKRRLGEPSKHSTSGTDQSYWRGRTARLVFGNQGGVCSIILFDAQAPVAKMIQP